jgi:hypothetical protein
VLCTCHFTNKRAKFLGKIASRCRETAKKTWAQAFCSSLLPILLADIVLYVSRLIILTEYVGVVPMTWNGMNLVMPNFSWFHTFAHISEASSSNVQCLNYDREKQFSLKAVTNDWTFSLTDTTHCFVL